MEKPNWGDTLTVGNKAMDMEHQLQIGLIQAVEDAIRGGQDRETASKLLGQLYEYTNAHFLAENLLMRLHAYPDYQAHADEHDRLVISLEALRKTFDSGENDLTLSSIDTLRSWLAGHIQGLDRRLSDYVSEHGIPIARRG
jgi:hemerythrin-like metal-binding protein